MAPSYPRSGGLAVGPMKRGKGIEIMAVADRSGLPTALHIDSASPHEVTLVEHTLGFVRRQLT